MVRMLDKFIHLKCVEDSHSITMKISEQLHLSAEEAYDGSSSVIVMAESIVDDNDDDDDDGDGDDDNDAAGSVQVVNATLMGDDEEILIAQVTPITAIQGYVDQIADLK
jgi:hypothetical protein